MTDNSSPLIPLNPKILFNPSGNRIWKDPPFWEGFLLDMGKGKIRGVTVRLLEGVLICPTPKNFGIGFGRALSPIPLPILSQKKHTTLALTL